MTTYSSIPHGSPEDDINASSSGLAGIGQAFARAIQSQFHPRMLFALLLPFLIMLGGAVVLLVIGLGPLTSWMDRQITESVTVVRADQWLVSIGLFSLIPLKAWLVPSILKSISTPSDFPIQLACIVLTRSGHSSSFPRSFSSLSA